MSSITLEGLLALNKIAKRNNPYYSFTNDTQFIGREIFFKDESPTSKCLICEEKVRINDNEPIDHGLWHLKEFNLLSFL